MHRPIPRASVDADASAKCLLDNSRYLVYSVFASACRNIWQKEILGDVHGRI